jgi:hypothetical protein
VTWTQFFLLVWCTLASLWCEGMFSLPRPHGVHAWLVVACCGTVGGCGGGKIKGIARGPPGMSASDYVTVWFIWRVIFPAFFLVECAHLGFRIWCRRR